MPTRPLSRCPTCKRLHPGTGRCPACRGTTTERGYGIVHQRRAARLRAESEQTDAPCCLCGEPIDYMLHRPHPMAFAAHHLTRDKLGPMGPTHAVCNDRAGQPDA